MSRYSKRQQTARRMRKPLLATNKEQELLSSSLWRMEPTFTSYQGTKRAERNYLRWLAHYQPSNYLLLVAKQGFECPDYWRRGE